MTSVVPPTPLVALRHFMFAIAADLRAAGLEQEAETFINHLEETLGR